jgi:hypothetical protein
MASCSERCPFVTPCCVVVIAGELFFSRPHVFSRPHIAGRPRRPPTAICNVRFTSRPDVVSRLGPCPLSAGSCRSERSRSAPYCLDPSRTFTLDNRFYQDYEPPDISSTRKNRETRGHAGHNGAYATSGNGCRRVERSGTVLLHPLTVTTNRTAETHTFPEGAIILVFALRWTTNGLRLDLLFLGNWSLRLFVELQ